MDAITVDSLSPPKFNTEQYISGFSGNLVLPYRFLPKFIHPPNRHILRSLLDPSNYKETFHNLLATEMDAQKRELSSYNLYGVKVHQHNHISSLYRLACPGIREFTPTVEIGDTLLLRQLRSQYSSYPHLAYTGYEHLAYVWQIDRPNGNIVIRIDNLTMESMVFNAQFCLNEKFYQICADAVNTIATYMEQSHLVSRSIRKFTFRVLIHHRMWQGSFYSQKKPTPSCRNHCQRDTSIWSGMTIA